MWSLKQGIRNKKKKGLYPSRDLHWIVPPILLRRVPLPHQVRLHRKVWGLLELRGSKVSNMSGLENPSDAQTKYLGPEPLLCHAKACNWVPVDGWNPCFAELWPTAEISDKEKAYFADGNRVWALAAEGRCFPTPESIVNLRPVARRTRAGSLLSSTVLNDGKESGACVSLLEKCHALALTACTGEQANVAHHAKVTGGRDRKTFFLGNRWGHHYNVCTQNTHPHRAWRTYSLFTSTHECESVLVAQVKMVELYHLCAPKRIHLQVSHVTPMLVVPTPSHFQFTTARSFFSTARPSPRQHCTPTNSSARTSSASSRTISSWALTSKRNPVGKQR